MATREEVYKALDSERNYQEERWPGHKHEIECYMLYMDDYLARAKTLASTTDLNEVQNHYDLMQRIRKITALGVAAMELHGAFKREGY